jgi:hypothetical protein
VTLALSAVVSLACASRICRWTDGVAADRSGSAIAGLAVEAGDGLDPEATGAGATDPEFELGVQPATANAHARASNALVVLFRLAGVLARRTSAAAMRCSHPSTRPAWESTPPRTGRAAGAPE